MYEALTGLSRASKRCILLLIDISILAFALLATLALQLETISPTDILGKAWPLFSLAVLLGAGLLFHIGLPRIKLATFGRNAVFQTALCAVFLIGIFCAVNYSVQHNIPQSISINFGVLFFAESVAAKITGQIFLEHLSHMHSNRKRVLIYGAGQAGTQLILALRQVKEYKPVAFIDDNAALTGLIISGLPVFPAKRIKEIIKSKHIDHIILAIPSMNDQHRLKLLKRLKTLNCNIQTLPACNEPVYGGGLVENLKPVSTDDLLGRDKVDLSLPVNDKTYTGKSVMVTGAGGSIGSELCYQILSSGIRKLVLFERSEFALYTLDRTLHPLAKMAGVELVPILGSVTDARHINAVLQRNEVQIILHAAAYKHVPLVETNVISGLHNNVVGTYILAEAAHKLGLERFILVSTDKAVRPTNVMGSSKRLAELIIQDLASRSKTTLFSMVRFGNVLGSSGSVIPLFRAQIAKGGPVTLTHRDVTRYFMTIYEASRLVLLAGTFAQGGDVFVLNMGKPIKIYDLACAMITLSGRKIRDIENPTGDIKIQITGLRPGEKLYEELLLDNNAQPTPHTKIFRAQDTRLSEFEVATAMRDLMHAIKTDDVVFAHRIIERWVDGYQSPRSDAA